MRRTAAADQRSGTSGPPAVALRGELWQRHVQLQAMDPASAEYDAAAAELLDLTSDLLRAEAEAAQVRRTVRRRFGHVLYYLGAVLLVAAIVVVALLAPAVGGWAYRWAYAALLVGAVVAATLMFRRRVASSPTAAVAEPEAGVEEPEISAEPAAGEATESGGEAEPAVPEQREDEAVRHG